MELKKWNEYRMDFLFISMASFIALLVGVMNIHIIFSKVDSILGWTEYEVIWMLGFYACVECLFHTLFVNCFDIGSWIYSGRMDLLKVRPRSVLFQLLFSERYNTEYPIDQFTMAVILLAWSSIKLNYSWTLIRIIAFMCSLIISTIIYTCIIFIISSFSFWTIKSNYLAEFVLELLDINQYPLRAYGTTITFLMTYVIPIGFVSFYPCQYLLAHKEYYEYALFSPVVAMILLVIAYVFWKKGIDRYQSPNT